MARIRAIKRRIRSVGRINQITKAMEKVAAMKMRKAQEATLRTRPYSISAREVLAHLVTLVDRKYHPLFDKREIQNRLIILLSSDRGLAGAYNSNVLRALMKALAGNGIPKLVVIGRKGELFARRLAHSGKTEIIGLYPNFPADPTSADARPIAHTVIEQYTSKGVDQVQLLYTNFVSSIRQDVVLRELLPIDPETILGQQGEVGWTIREALFEPTAPQVLEYIVPRLVEVQIFQAALEASASEHSMRMIAMKNASDNAHSLIGDLTLAYNSARQASITQELAEITGGAEAIR